MGYDFSMDLETILKTSLERHLYRNQEKTPTHLADSIRYSLLSPGKRIRPRMLLACSSMIGLNPETVMPAALALEMIHCFTLIHDDLPCMDNDDFRRGLPSNHKKFDESTALLAGDALMALAIDMFLDTPVEGAFLHAGLRRLTWAMGPRGVIGGQAAESTLNSDSSIEDLEWMHAQKTGALFSAALLIPKDFAGIPDDSPAGKSIQQFAYRLGLAFQTADDLEDMSEKDQPTHILFYLPAQEVYRKTIQDLNDVSDQLFQQFGERSLELRRIANEVIAKIQATQAS
jgi:geranylgeranyl diphosphate synthase type II